MPPVPACQALCLDKEECSTPHRIKFKKPGGKQQCREPQSGMHFPEPPSPFTHRSMWSPPDKTTFTTLSALKLNSFLSQPCVCLLVFPGQCAFQTGMSESDRNIMLCKSLKKYHRGTLGAQSRKETSPSNSQDPANQVLTLGCPQSHLSTSKLTPGSPQGLGTEPDPAPAHGDLAALTQGLIWLTLAPTTAFLTRARAKAQARGVSQAQGCASTRPCRCSKARLCCWGLPSPGVSSSAHAAAPDTANAS